MRQIPQQRQPNSMIQIHEPEKYEPHDLHNLRYVSVYHILS